MRDRPIHQFEKIVEEGLVLQLVSHDVHVRPHQIGNAHRCDPSLRPRIESSETVENDESVAFRGVVSFFEYIP